MKCRINRDTYRGPVPINLNWFILIEQICKCKFLCLGHSKLSAQDLTGLLESKACVKVNINLLFVDIRLLLIRKKNKQG